MSLPPLDAISARLTFICYVRIFLRRKSLTIRDAEGYVCMGEFTKMSQCGWIN